MIIQTNLFICEVCGATESHSEQTSPYSDPIVQPPKGWNYDANDRWVCAVCYSFFPVNGKPDVPQPILKV